MLSSRAAIQRGIMEPEELADLDKVFKYACRMNKTPPDTEAGKITAKRLMTAYRQGVRNTAVLRRLATSWTAQ
jgi:hypothetical protein